METSLYGEKLVNSRRQFLRSSSKLMVAGSLMSFGIGAKAAVRPSTPYFLSLDHTHTLERIGLQYRLGDDYLKPALGRLNRFLRDHYSGTVGIIDPRLYDILSDMKSLLRTDLAYHIISGYRDPNTNERLRTTRGGGVAKTSLHMQGRALDIRMPGVPLDALRDAALELKAGGVGYYSSDRFVHIDTGRVRSWGS